MMLSFLSPNTNLFNIQGNSLLEMNHLCNYFLKEKMICEFDWIVKKKYDIPCWPCYWLSKRKVSSSTTGLGAWVDVGPTAVTPSGSCLKHLPISSSELGSELG